MENKIIFRIEGPEISRLLSKLSEENLSLRNVKYISDTEIILCCHKKDFKIIEKFTKNKYRIEIRTESGVKQSLYKLKNRKATIAGVFLFVFLIFYQSLFISRIEITGLETVSQDEVMSVLTDNGIYVGCHKGSYDLEATEFDIFDRVKGFAWMELHEEGSTIIVDMVESKKVEEKETGPPSDIIATKEAYVEEIIALNGRKNVECGQQVKPGDILISGEIPNLIDDTKQMYVRSEGKVYGRCTYQMKREVSVSTEENSLTGKFMPGISIQFGDIKLDTSDFINFFDDYTINEKKLIDIDIPLPIKFSTLGINESEKTLRNMSLAEIKRNTEIEMLTDLKKNMGETGRIVKKDLQFRREENIIEVTGIFQVIEEIGREEPIIYERTEN